MKYSIAALTLSAVLVAGIPVHVFAAPRFDVARIVADIGHSDAGLPVDAQRCGSATYLLRTQNGVRMSDGSSATRFNLQTFDKAADLGVREVAVVSDSGTQYGSSEKLSFFYGCVGDRAIVTRSGTGRYGSWSHSFTVGILDQRPIPADTDQSRTIVKESLLPEHRLNVAGWTVWSTETVDGIHQVPGALVKVGDQINGSSQIETFDVQTGDVTRFSPPWYKVLRDTPLAPDTFLVATFFRLRDGYRVEERIIHRDGNVARNDLPVVSYTVYEIRDGAQTYASVTTPVCLNETGAHWEAYWAGGTIFARQRSLGCGTVAGSGVAVANAPAPQTVYGLPDWPGNDAPLVRGKPWADDRLAYVQRDASGRIGLWHAKAIGN